MPGFMKLISIVAACVMLAAPLTYQQCFDRYMRELQRINENEAYGIINHWQAVSHRVAAWQSYQACRDAAWEEWVRQWWRDTTEAIQ
jgi:hypothetical protein